ncbi:hypothetical protein GCM10009633_23750 [Janibacter melonis]|uniref:hypothetical protein n=1 Tax=Janibacter melonis TaxID=262209 RepID=UPI001E60A2A9|nr:hypothetical protein [Janibacter melonis]MCB5993204.1 hypothetical protein [Janibacter melonis]
MTWFPDNITAERRQAIRRASCAVVRLAICPGMANLARRQRDIVDDVVLYGDAEAWEAVAVLEAMLVQQGIATREQIEAAVRARAEREESVR